MPTVLFAGRRLACTPGATLRDVLLDGGATLYTPPMDVLHCRGLGTCGTCAVEVRPEVETGDPNAPATSPLTAMERWRLRFPPHAPDNAPVDPGATLRLACQVRVHDDVRCVRRGGLWGQGAPSMER